MRIVVLHLLSPSFTFLLSVALSQGWGFIECEETHKQFGSDVFLLKSDLGGYGVSKGDKVRFSVAQSEKGARATDVTVLEGGEAKGDDSAGQLFFGEVRSFNPQKGALERHKHSVCQLWDAAGRRPAGFAEALVSCPALRRRASSARTASSSGPVHPTATKACEGIVAQHSMA